MAEHNLEQSIFIRAIGLTEPEERAAYLDEACRDDQVLRAELNDLLAAHDRLGGAPPASQLAATQVHTPWTEALGAVIGPYKLLQQIGEGGMGTVFMAEQKQPVQRMVALKIIKPGMDSRQVLARFEAERQALALMDHPNIAKVLDGGTTDSGRPYFVMELVKGVPITRYCDEHRLGPRERLELFVPVCQAVQHAHQKGLIHRDLKPSNVLVTEYDDKPVAKVIDFGVAKATGSKLTERTMFTQLGQIVGTLEYMSPEQAKLNALDIDTRSDIYALGVILYELLTGTTPLDRKRFYESALDEMLRVIREEEPPRPSTRLSTTEELPAIAANRGLEPRKLSGVLRGELDWIVMKALEKDRNRRYESANGLARDVQRYLSDEPVQACPPSLSYRLSKLVRRHKGKMAVAAVMLVLVLAATAISTLQAVRATLAEEKTRDALGQVKAEQTRTQQVLDSAREALDTLTDDVVQTMFTRQPELGETEKAFLRKVLKHHEAVAQQDAETAKAKFTQAQGQYKVAFLRELLGEQPVAITGYQQAAALLQQLVDQFPNDAEYRHKLARTHGNLGILLAEAGKPAEAEAAFRQGIALRMKLADQFPKKYEYRTELAKNHSDLASLYLLQSKYDDAVKAYAPALELHEKLVAEDSADPSHLQDLARLHTNLGMLLRKQEKYAEAEPLYLQAIKIQEEQINKSATVPKRRRELADSYHGYGIVLAELGKEDESEKRFEQSAAMRKKLVDEFPSVRVYERELAATYNDLAYLQSRRKRFAEAEETCRRAVELVEKLISESGALPAYRQLLSLNYTNLGQVLQEQKKDAEAEKAYRDSLKLDLKLIEDFPKLSEHRLGAANVLLMLATLQQQRQDFAAAIALHQEARSHLKAALDINPKDPASRRLYRDNLRPLAKCYMSLADHAKLAATADELADLGFEPPSDTFDAATMLAACVPLANKDAALAESSRNELAQKYADRALVLVRQAIERGFSNVDRMKQDPRLEAIRSREDFQKLLADLETKK